MKKRTTVAWLLLAPLFAAVAPAAPPRDDDPWGPYRFLEGDWEAEGGGQPGAGNGRFSFARELQGKILVRRNVLDLPAKSGREAARHEDLMVIYREEAGKAPRASYFDSEGHVIHYAPTFSEEGRTLTFLSEPSPSAPRFRLTYRKVEGEKLRITFEIAPPGKSEDFKSYLEGTARRVRSKAEGPSD